LKVQKPVSKYPLSIPLYPKFIFPKEGVEKASISLIRLFNSCGTVKFHSKYDIIV
jgi:hypothetical protein